jgi:hypothetical protein
MQCRWGRVAFKRRLGNDRRNEVCKAKNRPEMCEKKIRRQTQDSEKNESGELSTDRDFLHRAIHTVGGDRSE